MIRRYAERWDPGSIGASTGGGGWSSSRNRPRRPELVDDFALFHQPEILASNRLDLTRIIGEGPDLPIEFFVDLPEPCDLLPKFGPRLTHLKDLNEALLPNHRGNRDHNRQLLKLMSIEPVMPSNHLILCHDLLWASI